MGIFNQQPNYNQSFTKGKRGITGPQGPPDPPGPAGASGTGFNLTADGNYDMVNKKLANMAEGTTSSDAITKNQLDTAMGTSGHGNDQNIDLKDTYNVIHSKRQTFIERNRNRNTLVCYEDVRDVFVSRKESVFPMETYLDMGNHYIYNVKAPINNDQGVNKSYADTKLSLSGGLMTGNLDMNNNRIYNVAQPNGDNQPATKIWSENTFLAKNGGVMASNLNMSNNEIINVGDATNDKDGISRSFGDSRHLKLAGGAMSGPVSVADLDLSLGYRVIRNHVLNYKSINNYYFPKSGGKIGTTFSKGYIYNLRNPLYEDSRGDDWVMPRLYADNRYVKKLGQINMNNNMIISVGDALIIKMPSMYKH